MKKFTKFSIGIGLVVLIGLVAFVGCQKEMDKLDANKPLAGKALTIEPFGNVPLGEYHNAHLDRLTELSSFPYYEFEQQFNLAKEHLPEGYPASSVNIEPGTALDLINPISDNPDHVFDYVKGIMEEHGVSDMAIEYTNKLMIIMDEKYYEALEAQNLEICTEALKELQYNVDMAGLNPVDHGLLTDAITVAYYSGAYWYDVASNEKNAWYPVWDKSKCNWWCKIKKAVRVARADIAGTIVGYAMGGPVVAAIMGATASALEAKR